MWLRLTRASGRSLVVNLDNVCAIDGSDAGATVLYAAGGENKWDQVQETPEQILSLIKDKQYV